MTAGLYYRFKTRVKNEIGWSDWSVETNLQAAMAPSKPEAPQFVTSDTSSITLKFKIPEETGGSALTQFKLFMNDGQSNTEATT